MRKGQGNITVSALKAKFDTPIPNNKTEGGTTKKVTERNARYKPHSSPPDKTNHATKATATIQPYSRGISATLDRKPNREETHKRLSYTKTESGSCDKSTLNGNGPSESGSRLSMTTNKINIPAAFSKETPSTKQHGRYGGSRQGSKDSNSENSLENSPKKTYGSSGSPKNLTTDKGIAMRDVNEIKNIGEGLVKKRAELLFQNVHGSSAATTTTTTTTTTKSKPSSSSTSDQKDSLQRGISMTKGIILRERDGKRFRLCSKTKLNTTQKCPCRPKKLESNQFQALLKQYRKTVEALRKSGELYIEERPSSLIPELTEEEEAELEGSASSHSSTSTTNRPMPPLPRKTNPTTNGSEPDQTYDDVMNTIKNEVSDDLYDDLDTLDLNSENQELEKKKEKEKKEKEEKKRKEREEKERKKQEKEEKKIRAKFKMDGTEKVVGEGTYTAESCKGGKLDLTVKKGDKISILRMHNNPAGKWLAKTEDGKVGYIESQSVEICTSNIKNVMEVAGGSYANFTPASGYAPGEEENSQDDIYEEIPKCD